ncbi:autotransporter domain-containing protein [Allosphingosinicella deserti]|uniref:Autotransporter domain-containing esterase n=1 Tax=Allosphingosinicella deserti TaxID=2116704 RepID=A0A2P7QY23_9SPHN|nr:autotransporter domain-containing protein [Sphingomonas deserti]PSJ42870.1 autotransporter domain-containing esterase [Sphingomonas deserti]
MSRSRFAFPCAAAAAALLCAAPAAAQTVDRIVAFGDSYADDGNFFELTNIPRPAIYPNGRFSNGTNFVDTMGQLLSVPIDNFAIGGAFANNGNINGAAFPGFVTEYQSFLAGGGPAAFPRVSGRLDANDLVVVSIGGNDARAYERSLGPAPTAAQVQGLIAGAPAQAQLRVGETMTGINALVNAGARNITFLAGDVGRLPEVAGSPIAPIGTAYANAFNSGIQTRLAETAANGVIVDYLDLSQVGSAVERNPAAFGLISAGACPVACVTTDPSLLDKYLFYVDQLHLTSAGFAIVGRYAVRQLEAPLHFQAQTDLGLQAASSFGSTLQGRLDLSTARTGDNGSGLSVYAMVNAASRKFARSATNLAYDTDTFGVTAGAEYELGSLIFGLALNHSRPRADMIAGTGKVRAKAWQVGGYAGWADNGAFVQAHGGIGWVDYDITRNAVIDEITAEADGRTIMAGAKAGYLLDLGGFSLGPVVGLQYAKAKIDAYSETGDAVLTLDVDDQNVKALVGSAGLEARGTLDAGGLAVHPFAALTAEKDFEGDGRTIRYAGTASPAIVNSFVLPNRSRDVYGRLAAGARLSLGEAASLAVEGSTSFSQDGSDDIAGFVGLTVGF